MWMIKSTWLNVLILIQHGAVVWISERVAVVNLVINQWDSNCIFYFACRKLHRWECFCHRRAQSTLMTQMLQLIEKCSTRNFNFITQQWAKLTQLTKLIGENALRTYNTFKFSGDEGHNSSKYADVVAALGNYCTPKKNIPTRCSTFHRGNGKKRKPSTSS
ncbi:hypothetical protein PR048_013098 [Dryococelus australis]|uniref:Uncharacterized protein n=1 Tax=Dryococelus australis TaxID=614101 RepID=A0ABQ9HRD1_9NEOP|nr:hypothetical protein PR048_013098 [Dryococelus australis]